MITKERKANPDGSFTETTTEQQSSVTIKKTSKGELTYEMKIYQDDPEKFEEMAKKFLGKIKDVMEESRNLQI